MRLDGSSILFPSVAERQAAEQAQYEAWLAEEQNYGPTHKFAYDNERPSRCRKCRQLNADHA
jgi:hypothetical protein